MVDFDSIKPGLKSLAEEHKLDFVALFGSQATGRTHAKSDIDIAYISRDKVDWVKFGTQLYRLFDREDVETADLATASPTLLYVVARDGKLLYEKELGAFLKWKLYAIWTWLDTAWLRDLRNRKLIEWARTT